MVRTARAELNDARAPKPPHHVHEVHRMATKSAREDRRSSAGLGPAATGRSRDACASDIDALRTALTNAEQTHLLTFYETLDDEGRRRLIRHLNSLDISRVPALARFAAAPDEPGGIAPPTHALEPAPYHPLDPKNELKPWDRDRAQRIGESLLRDGKVAVLTVAGGQGTRLGFDGPKGCFPAGPVTQKSLFHIFAEQVLAASRQCGVALAWRIMTSPLNHDETVASFRDHTFFNLDPTQVGFFQQGVLPSFDIATGAMLLAEADAPATNPDGHGGSLKAISRSGALDELLALGVEHLSYSQIDNPLVRLFDPVFLGLHADSPDSSAQMSSKMIAKTDPDEKVGVFCLADGLLRVIEYSDLPPERARERRTDGSLRFNAGSPAIHIIALDFIRRLNSSEEGFALPLHRAKKIVPHLDLLTGRRITPDRPNAIKLETFIFDALPLAARSLLLETDRAEFAPIKNATGPDSPETCNRLQTERNAAWLERAGVHVPRRADGAPDCTIEISPLTAMESESLKSANLPAAIARGSALAI